MSSAAALPLGHPRLQPTTVPTGPRSPRPHLRVLEGGRGPAQQRQAAIYRRRRAVALVLAAALLAAIVLLASAVLAGSAGGGTPTSAAGTTAAEVHVVQPGETLWSIARQLDPSGDVRITVDRLAALNGDAPLVAGQRLVLP